MIKTRVTFLAGVSLIAALILVVIFWFRPEGPTAWVFPPCLFHKMTGLYCPGCGFTRAVHSLLHGDIVSAVGYNPLFVVSLPLILLCGLDWIKLFLTRKPLFSFLKSPFLTWPLAVAVIAFFIMRNIPTWPFTFLAPG